MKTIISLTLAIIFGGILLVLMPLSTDAAGDSGANNYDLDFKQQNQEAQLSGRVWHDRFHDANHKVDGIQDAGEPSIEGVVVELYDSNGNVIATDTTDANGYYEFTNLASGSYTLDIADSVFAANGALDETDDAIDWHASQQDEGSDDTIDSDGNENNYEIAVSLASGENKQHLDYGFFNACIHFTKTGPSTMQPGVAFNFHFRVENCGDVVLHGGASVYDALLNPDGNHKIWNDVVYAGEVKEFDKSYTPSEDECPSLLNEATGEGHPVDPRDDGGLPYVSEDDSWTVTCANDTATLGDFVWEDLNADGVQDTNEPGVGNVTVQLLDVAGSVISTTTTSSTGAYSFTNLIANDYAIKVTLPNGYQFSPQDQGNDDTTDSDSNSNSGQTVTTTLDAGETDLSWDAGIYQPASLGDFVWWDQNNDGVQQANEPGLEGVTVTLKNSVGNSIGSTTTDSNGAYSFTGLTPGNYIINFTLPGTDWSFSPQDQGTDDSLDSDADSNSGDTGTIALNSGDNNTTIDAGMTIVSSYTLTKTNTTIETELAPGDPVSFTISIKNTGNTWIASLPVTDTYNANYISYVNATPATDNNVDDGEVSWNDIITSLGHQLAPNEQVDIVVNFTAKASTENLPNHVTINYAGTHDVTTDPDGPDGPNGAIGTLPDLQDDASVNILNPVHVTMSSFQARAAGNAVHLQWTSLSEYDVMGFNVLRSVDGSAFEPINQALIPARYAGADAGTTYRFNDRPEADSSIIYVLEIVHLNGSVTQFGHITLSQGDRF